MLTFSRKCLAGFVLAGLAGPMALANGINPPKPSGADVIEVTCTNRVTRGNLIVKRARINPAKPAGTMEVRFDSSPPKSLQLSQIRRVEIATGETAQDGFATASFELADQSDRRTGFVRLSSNGKPVRLTGFSPDTDRIDVPLASCSQLTLRVPLSNAGREHAGLTKK